MGESDAKAVSVHMSTAVRAVVDEPQGNCPFFRRAQLYATILSSFPEDGESRLMIIHCLTAERLFAAWGKAARAGKCTTDHIAEAEALFKFTIGLCLGQLSADVYQSQFDRFQKVALRSMIVKYRGWPLIHGRLAPVAAFAACQFAVLLRRVDIEKWAKANISEPGVALNALDSPAISAVDAAGPLMGLLPNYCTATVASQITARRTFWNGWLDLVVRDVINDFERTRESLQSRFEVMETPRRFNALFRRRFRWSRRLRDNAGNMYSQHSGQVAVQHYAQEGDWTSPVFPTALIVAESASPLRLTSNNLSAVQSSFVEWGKDAKQAVHASTTGDLSDLSLCRLYVLFRDRFDDPLERIVLLGIRVVEDLMSVYASVDWRQHDGPVATSGLALRSVGEHALLSEVPELLCIRLRQWIRNRSEQIDIREYSEWEAAVNIVAARVPERRAALIARVGLGVLGYTLSADFHQIEATVQEGRETPFIDSDVWPSPHQLSCLIASASGDPLELIDSDLLDQAVVARKRSFWSKWIDQTLEDVLR